MITWSTQMAQLKIWHHGHKKCLIWTLSTSLLKKRSPLKNGQKNAEDQYPKLIFNLEDQYSCSWRISILNSFLIWRISIPNQFQKDLGDTVVKTVDLSWGCTKGAHRECTAQRGTQGSAQGAHSGSTGSAQCTFFPTFLLFKLDRWNLVSRIES